MLLGRLIDPVRRISPVLPRGLRMASPLGMDGMTSAFVVIAPLVAPTLRLNVFSCTCSSSSIDACVDQCPTGGEYETGGYESGVGSIGLSAAGVSCTTAAGGIGNGVGAEGAGTTIPGAFTGGKRPAIRPVLASVRPAGG